ncbi:MAG: flagellar hook capping protein [Ignavibacteriaceae bacterium]|nr:flagellar hook capping protein [Ignavibacteriaceae bacterium]
MISELSNYTTSLSTTNAKATMGKDDFLELMLTQLKNQDPLSPLEGTEFAAQLAQFTSLEQLMNLNDSMETSIDANYYLTQSINNTLAATLIGKEVKLSTNEFSFSGQESMSLGYNLSSQANNITVKIYNESGSLIKTIENAPKMSGDNKLIWNLTDNEGNKVPQGKYRFEVEATDSQDLPISASKFIVGQINGVKFSSYGTKLLINGSDYMLSDIMEIYNSANGG